MMISGLQMKSVIRKFLLIVKDYVRSPDVVAGYVKLGHSAIFIRIPL